MTTGSASAGERMGKARFAVIIPTYNGLEEFGEFVEASDGTGYDPV